MFDLDLQKYGSYFKNYGELRLQKNSTVSLRIVNGDVRTNTSDTEQGISVRTGSGGIWGFSCSGKVTDQTIMDCLKNAESRYKWLSSKQKRKLESIPAVKWQGNFQKQAINKKLSSRERIDFLQELDNYASIKYPKLSTRSFFMMNFDVEKKYLNSCGSSFHLNRPYYYVALSLSTTQSGEPVSLYDVISGVGFAEDKLLSPQQYFHKIDQLYEHLQKKSEGVYARSGIQDVVMDADLAGILSHEAIGHTTEADSVITGSVAADLMDKKVSSELVTLVDIAHSYDGKECVVPVYVDDEGTRAEDAVIIEKGILKNYMHDRSSAQHFGMKACGNARAYGYYDEPLIRMRNTMILPGESKLEDMIADVDDGYYLMKSSNGQADSTSEFMFGITMGYEIRKGKLGKAIKDTTISGIAFDVLKSVSAVSKGYKMNMGFCGKKQTIAVGMGGPAIRCKVNIGGK